MSTPEVWAALLHVVPAAGSDYLEGSKGAFVNALSLAADGADFKERVSRELDSMGLELQSIENLGRLFHDYGPESDKEDLIRLARAAQQSATIQFTCWHLYDDD